MNKNRTELVLVMDNSGSMTGIKNDVEQGLKTVLKEQADQPGECFVSYYQFSGTTNCVFNGADIKNVKDITINPLGSTALFDAIGLAINETGARLKAMKEKDRPGLVVFIVGTDGEENSSKEFSGERIKKMIQHQESKYNWQFIYLGANQDAWQVGQHYGFSSGKSMTYTTNSNAIHDSYGSTSKMISDLRGAVASGHSNLSSFTFSDEDRKNSAK
jgi:uncharacterized protein YegL